MFSPNTRFVSLVVFSIALCASGGAVTAEPGPVAGSAPWHTFSCGEVTSHLDNFFSRQGPPDSTPPAINWTRTFCFDGDIKVKKFNALPRRQNVGSPARKGSKADYLYLTLTLRVKKQVYDNGAPGEAQAVCGDSLRVIFSSSQALFSPVRMTETACGEHTMSFVLPRESEAYAVELRLMHVEGEGMRDPVTPLWPPEQDLMHHAMDGPVVYNLDAAVRGLLHGPRGYARLPLTAPAGRPALVNESTITGADLGMGDAAAHPHTEHGRGSYRDCRRMCREKDESEWTEECRLLDAKLGYSLALPACTSGNHPGRWFKSGSMYALFQDPWVWQPYSCVYYFYSSEDLNTCLDHRQKRAGIAAKEGDWPTVKFMGESTLNAIFNEWDEKLNTKYFYWDPVVDMGDDKRTQHVGYQANETSGKASRAELHGLEKLVEEGLTHFIKRGRNFHPEPTGSDAVIMLEGANDVQKDTMARFVSRMKKVVHRLEAAEEEDTYFRKASTLVWISPPSRHYKPTGGFPGMSHCDHGGDCENTGAPDWFVDTRAGQGRSSQGVQWRTYSGAQIQLFDTVDRRRLANKIAVRMLKAAFPRLKVVDYRALTEPLPTDYSFDGEHYHCPTLYIRERLRFPWQCIPMVNEVVSNIVANVLCNSVSYVAENEYPYYLSRTWANRMIKHQKLVMANLEQPEVWSPPVQDDDVAGMKEEVVIADSQLDPRVDEWITNVDADLEAEVVAMLGEDK